MEVNKRQSPVRRYLLAAPTSPRLKMQPVTVVTGLSFCGPWTPQRPHQSPGPGGVAYACRAQKTLALWRSSKAIRGRLAAPRDLLPSLAAPQAQDAALRPPWIGGTATTTMQAPDWGGRESTGSRQQTVHRLDGLPAQLRRIT